MNSSSRASNPQLDTTTTTMTDSSGDRNDGAAARTDSPLSSSDEAVESKNAALPTLAAKEQTIMPLADSPSAPTDGMLEGGMVVDPSPFMRIPAELRIPIYKLLVLPIPFEVIECPSEDCGNHWSFLASTCKPASSQIRTYNCEDCQIRHRSRKLDVHLQILRTSRQIYHEASAVLYEHVQVMAGGTGGVYSHNPTYPSAHLVPHIRHLCWTVTHDDIALRTLTALDALDRDRLPDFPNLQIVRLHQDVELCTSGFNGLDDWTFYALTCFGDQVEFVIDVHIVRAWSDDDLAGWCEEIISRPANAQRAKELDIIALKIRRELVNDLSEAFKRKGKVLKIREEGVVEAEAAKDQQDGMMKPEVAEDQHDGMMDAEVAEDQQEG